MEAKVYLGSVQCFFRVVVFVQATYIFECYFIITQLTCSTLTTTAFCVPLTVLHT